MLVTIRAEYIWIDGTEPTPKVRSKTKVFALEESDSRDFPVWCFDGSSTGQADGSKSDVILKPVRHFIDPTRGPNSYLVMCETFNADGSPNSTNHRAKLRETEEKYRALDSWVGFEQEYVFLKEGRPLGWPAGGYPPPQGPFYCGVGADEVFGREIVEKHLQACIDAGLGITGINAEVMPGQWEFQMFAKSVLEASDMLWVARWLLYRIAEDFGVCATLYPKPVSGDWNGSGMHTNFSTIQMREGVGEGTYVRGLDFINSACEAIGRKIPEHLAVYGVDNDKRLTGKHETCSINEFRYGVSDRGASIRIPLQVSLDGKGYLEDRRPAANADPYQVAEVLLSTVGQCYFEAIFSSTVAVAATVAAVADAVAEKIEATDAKKI